MTSGLVAERATALSVMRGGRLGELSRLPRLDTDPWPAVATAHRKRHGARPGERDEQVTLVAACSALQTVLLAQELTDPVLPGMPQGPWTSQLPAWLLPCLDSRSIGVLLRAAVELDLALTSWPLPPPTTTADLLVRHALIRMTRSWATPHTVAVDIGTLASVLQIARSPGALLWDQAGTRVLADPVEQHARGLELLDPRSWGCPVHQPKRDPRIVFKRRRPASPSDTRLGRPVVIELWGHPGRLASAAQSRAVSEARSSGRRAGQGFIPTGRHTDITDLGASLTGTCTAEVRLTWQPLLGAPTRATPVLLRGLEVDEQGLAWVLVIWDGSVLAVPLRAVVAVELMQRAS